MTRGASLQPAITKRLIYLTLKASRFVYSPLWSLYSVTFSQSLFFRYNHSHLHSTQTAAVDLSSLGLGRPRDLVLVDGNMKAIRSDVLRQSIISFGGENSSPEKDDSSIESKCTCIAMTTSTGFLALLSLSGIELVGSVSNRATDGDALPVEAVVLAMHHVKGDPRFTALTALNTAHMESKKKIGNGPDISLHGDNPVTEDAAVQLIESNDINGKKRKVQFDEADGDARSGKAMKSTTEKLNRSDRNSLFGKPTVTIIEEDGDQSPQKKTSNSRAKAGKNRKETHDSKSAGNLMRR